MGEHRENPFADEFLFLDSTFFFKKKKKKKANFRSFALFDRQEGGENEDFNLFETKKQPSSNNIHITPPRKITLY